MTNSELLEEYIKKSGIKKVHITKVLNVSYPTFKRKIDNLSPFIAEEIRVLCDLLRISKDDRELIFFNTKVDK